MVAVFVMFITIAGGSFLSIANSQPQTTNTIATKKPLPVLLIHGYASDASAWSKWEDLLKKDGVTFYPITLYKSDDKCGSAAPYVAMVL